MVKNYYIISDLHLEGLVGLCTWQGKLCDDKEILKNSYIPLFAANPDEYNILLIAGDFCEARHLHYFIPFLSDVAEQFNYREIYYIAGNHEYWHKSFSQSESLIRENIAQNPILSKRMHFLQNNRIDLDTDTVLLGATLWYDLKPVEEYPVSLKMNDYKRIRGDDFGKLRYGTHIKPRFYESWNFLNNQLSEIELGKQVIILSHHVIGNSYLKLTPYNDSAGYGSLIPDNCLDNIFNHRESLFMIHGHCHIRYPQTYLNEYGISSFCNTIGYWDQEYKGTPHNPLKLPLYTA